MKRLFKGILTFSFMLLICLSIGLFGEFEANKMSAAVRDIELEMNNVDYQSMFNDFKDAKLSYDSKQELLIFSGTQTLNSSIFSEIDMVNFTNDGSENLDVNYSFEYDADDNLFFMTIKAVNVNDGEIVDRILGIPFVNEKEEIDIAFSVEDEIIYLSDLESNPILQNCGWFSKLLKKVAKVAVGVAVVAAVVVVAVYVAPAVVAAASTASMALAGTSIAAGATATISATTAATLATVGTIAANTAIIAGTTAAICATGTAVIESVEQEIKERDNTTIKEKIDTAIDSLKRKRPNDTIILRWGTNSYYNLTPRTCDTSGLSFTTLISYKNCVVTTVELVNSTGVLTAVRDGSTHVSVTPTAGDLASWMATKDNANNNPHQYSIALKNVVIKI